MLRKLYLYVLLFVSVSAFSQVKVEGTVIDELNSKPLQGVKVRVSTSPREAVTNSKGKYTLQLPEGEHLLLFSLSGYSSAEQLISLGDTHPYTVPTVSLSGDYQQEAEQLAVITESELEDDESGADAMSGLLQSSQDVFMRRAAFDFSSVFFKPRGYDSKDVTVLINGISMNRLENGRAQWANWGGLNDITRNQEMSNGLVKSDYTFGGLMGSNYINIRPSLNRAGLRVTTSASNRSYTGRLMATYNSGVQRNGLAYMVSASRRFAPQGSWVDGTLYNAYAFAAGIEYQLNNYSSFNLIGMFSPVKRGKTSPLTREVLDLMGYQYNPFWGKQNGDKRNSRNRIVSEPIFVFSYNYLKNDTRLNVDLGYQFGEIGNTRISYSNAQNPEPNYYKLLPSYYLNQNPSDPTMAALQKDYFLTHSQLDWEELYRANYNTTDKRSAFIVSNDINRERTFSANVNFSTPIHENIKWTSGVVYRNVSSDNFAEVEDLLGGDYFMNYDYFEGKPYNADETDMKKKQGDKWNYFYALKSNVAEVFSQFEFTFKNVELFVAGRYHYTDIQREGKFNYPLYADSYGKGAMQVQNGMSTKAGLTYALTGRHLLQANVGYFNTPQSVRNIYANVRNSNRLLPNIKNELAYTADASYILRMPYLKGRLTGFFTEIENTAETNFFYTETALTDEIDRDFVAQTVEGIKKRHFGLEFGAEAQLIPTLKLTAVASVGQYTYINNPSLYISSGEVNKAIDEVTMKNYHVPSGPQQAYSLGLEYRHPKYWWIGATANFLAQNYVSLSALNRTSQFFIDPSTKAPFTNIDTDLARKLLKQERLDDVFLVNLVGGKSWRLNKTYVSLMVSVNNLFDTQFLSGGFEQSRTANYGKMVQDNAQGVPSFGNRYFVGYGRTYMVNLAVSL